MATVVQPIIEPNRDAIKAHLSALFLSAREEYPDGLIEVAHGASKATEAAHFAMHDDGIEEAATWASNRNREGQNIYVGVNPRKRLTKVGVRSSDTDVEVAFFHFADLDKEEAVAKARGDLPVRPTMIVMTGTVPNNRPHLYWRLEEPTANMAAWTERQRGIAQSLGGDAVINPSRIMRLAGTVNYPTQEKLGRGYRMEPTTIRTEFNTERPPVTPELVAQAYPQRRIEVSANIGQLESGQTTLAAMSRGTRIADLINACRSGVEWHNSMVRLVAHLTSMGRADAEILGLAAGITLPGYSIDQTLREMITALRGARQKWNIPEPEDSVEQEEQKREAADSVYETLSLDQLEDLPPPTYLIDELLPEHGLTIVYGDPGAGKSFVVLDMALRLPFGMDWHGTAAKKTGVLYIAGEGKHGLGKRVKGWRKEFGLEGADAPFKLLPVAVHMLDKPSVEKLKRTIDAVRAEVQFEIGLVVIDTVSRAISGQDENKQEAMSLFVDGCAEIQTHTNGAVIGVHHAGKDKEKGMRGSTVLLGGCDASIKVSKDERAVTLNVEKQKDDEEAAPIYLTMKKVEWQTGLEKPLSTLVPEKSQKPLMIEKTLSKRDAGQIFDEVDRAWTMGRPWSVTPHSRGKGRYLPEWVMEKFEVSHDVASAHVIAWQKNDYMAMENYSRDTRAQGLRVLKRLEQDQ